MKNTSSESNVREEFFAPMVTALRQSSFSRNCSGYTDRQHAESGVGRVLKPVASGRDWVQHLVMKFGISVSVGNFFAALRSRRRYEMVREIGRDVRRQADILIGNGGDPLSRQSELEGFAVYAVDGHTHGASAHEKERYGKKRPVTHLYALNLRMHTLTALALAIPGANRKKEHELTTLKRAGGAALRMEEKKGVKVIHVYDPAIVDYAQWYKWKKGSGIYILTMEKSNSALYRQNSARLY